MIQQLPEAQLVQRSVSGDRRAFEEIVRRNVSPVSAVAYAVTGDAALSEDVTQEVFITAWQKLKDLRNTDKLRSWLCTIARNLARNYGRQNVHDPLHAAVELGDTNSMASVAPSPAENAIASEQQRLVWSAIEHIPETYRVPLVLYYREGKSTTEVAQALEISDETARQRLSRARAMLKDEVVRMVEKSICSTRPSPMLVATIMAGLASGAIHASAATTTTIAAAKFSAGAGTTAAFSGALFATLLGPIIGLAGGIAGSYASLRAAKTPAERKIIVRIIWQTWVLVAVWMVGLSLLITSGARKWTTLTETVVAGIVLLCVYVITLVVLVIRGNRQFFAEAKLRAPHLAMTPLERHLEFIERLKGDRRSGIIGAYAGSVYGSLSWLLVEAAVQQRFDLFVSVLVAATIVVFGCVSRSFQSPKNYLIHFAVAIFSVPLIVCVAIAYWKLTGMPPHAHFSSPGEWNFVTSPLFPLFIGAVTIPVGVTILVQHRKYKRLTQKA